MEYEVHEYYYIIKFANVIMIDKTRNKGQKNLCYKVEKWKKVGTFDIMNNISDHVTLLKLINSLGDMNHAVSVVGKCFLFK